MFVARIFTLYPEFFPGPLAKGLYGKALVEKIQKIATETSSDILRQLIGEEVNNSSISAIVDDLSKKNKGKYYGN